MMILDRLKEALARFERKEIFKISLIYLGLCAVIVGVIMVRHLYELQQLQGKIKSLNKSRVTAQELLTKYQAVQQQKNKVLNNLNQNKSFRIQQFFQDIAQKNGLTASSYSDKFNRQKLPNGFFEESLQITINQIDTKTMCELLLDIEQEPIVYVIGLDITKNGPVKKINVALSIATIKSEG